MYVTDNAGRTHQYDASTLLVPGAPSGTVGGKPAFTQDSSPGGHTHDHSVTFHPGGTTANHWHITTSDGTGQAIASRKGENAACPSFADWSKTSHSVSCFGAPQPCCKEVYVTGPDGSTGVYQRGRLPFNRHQQYNEIHTNDCSEKTGTSFKTCLQNGGTDYSAEIAHG